MTERTFFEFEALWDRLNDAIESLGLEMDTQNIIEGLSEQQLDGLNDILVELFNDQMLGDLVSWEPEQSPPGRPEGYGLRFRTQRREGKPVKMAFYRVRKSWLTSGLSLIGLGLALFMGSPTAALPGIELVLNTWRNMVTLKRPNDALALDCYEALLKVQATEKQQHKVRHYCPSLAEIQAQAGHTSKEDTVNGMTQLLQLQLVTVKEWGDQPDDHGHSDNRWYQVF